MRQALTADRAPRQTVGPFAAPFVAAGAARRGARTSRPLMAVMVLALRCAVVRGGRAATERTKDCTIIVVDGGG